MKKILIVGGGANQLPLILASKREGYEVTVVDYAGENCPGYALADRLYGVSTQDEAAILEVARKERVDGIISNSEPSMLIVNGIATKLGLTGNPVDSIEQLTSKSLFRDLQRRAGVYAPEHYEVATEEEALTVSERLCYPLIVKPCEASASRGCRRIDRFDREAIASTFQECSRYSRNKDVVVEKYVTMPSLRTIEGDIFVAGDTILWDGLYYTTRAGWAPLVPMTYTAPLVIGDDRLAMIQSAVRRILHAAGVRFGEFNMEGFFTQAGEFFVIEINARQGGNFLPRFLQRSTGIDYNRLLVTMCVNDDGYLNSIMASPRERRYAIMHSVYSQEAGIYQGLMFDTSLSCHVTRVTELLSIGGKVERCVDGTSIVASVDLEFDTMDELYAFTPRIIDGIQVKLSSAS